MGGTERRRQRLIVIPRGTAYADVWATDCDHPFPCWCATLVSRVHPVQRHAPLIRFAGQRTGLMVRSW